MLGLERMRLRLFFFHSGDQFTAAQSMSSRKVRSPAVAVRMISARSVTPGRLLPGGGVKMEA